jgi:TPR repeat protein
MLGQCFLNGRGINRDPQKAAVWIKQAAGSGDQIAQFTLGIMYTSGEGVKQNPTRAYKWYLEAAAQGHIAAMANIGVLHETGQGVKQNFREAFRWYEMAAKPGLPVAQCNLGQLYATGRGVKADPAKAAEWYLKAAQQGHAQAQFLLGTALYFGNGVKRDPVMAYQWICLAANYGSLRARQHRRTIGDKLTPSQFNIASNGVRKFMAKHRGNSNATPHDAPKTGTGFFVTHEGHLLTNHLLIAGAKRIEARTAKGNFEARVVQSDPTSDLALLQIKTRSTPLHLGISRAIRLGEEVFTVGFPHPHGVEPKLTDGKVSSLLGAQDDPRYYQVSIPLQPGNTGGALVDDSGLTIGIIGNVPNNPKALKLIGSSPQNLNHALKSNRIAAFLSSIPEARTKIPLQQPVKQSYKEAIKATQTATVLILVHH